MIGKHTNSTPRKTRTKLRKPKYLSLRRRLIDTPPSQPLSTPPMPTNTGHRDQKQLIDLFPLHPENLVEQEKIDEEHNMACMLSSCENDAATTLSGILCSGDDDYDHEDEENTNNPSPSSVNCADEEVELVRTAMRRNKTDGNVTNDHEKWVCYSESSTTSCYHNHHNHHHNNNNNNNLDHQHHHRSKLVLKLDYEKIMNSWVNKGPLFIYCDPDVDAPQPQTVPNLQDDGIFVPSSSINGKIEAVEDRLGRFIYVTTHDEQDNDGNGGSWMVPEIGHIENKGTSKGDDAMQTRKSSAMAHNREASVQRYKEKRRNRLFAKTVRYEVRKLNAEKRPRIKGRFVKSS